MTGNQVNYTIEHPLGLIINTNRNNTRNEAVIRNVLERLNFKLYSINEQEPSINLEEKLKQDLTSKKLEGYDFLLCFVFVKSNCVAFRIYILI
jgi:hypothetical protein